MQLAAWFPISLSALIALSGLMLTIAEGRPSPQMLTPVLAFLGLVWTDRRQTFQLTPGWATGVAFFGFCLALAELFAGGVESRLLWGAHLLVYLTWVLIFLPKTALLYWLLCALCLLQVAVGAVLMTSNAVYGGLVVVYFFLALWTLALFSLQQAQQRLELAGGLPGIGPQDDRALRGAGFRPLLAVATGGPAGLAPAIERLREASQVQGAIQLDPHERWLRLRFVTGMFLAACLSLAVGLVFFLLTPRIWIGSGPPRDLEPTPAIRLAITGFSDNVQLGEFGQILTSPEPVFEVRLYEHDSGVPLDILDYALQSGLDEPLFRGAVMSRYVPRTGRWESATSRNWLRLPSRGAPGMVRQEITLEPIDTDVLFAMHPVRGAQISIRRSQPVVYQDESTARVFSSRQHDQRFSYTVFSPRHPRDADDLVRGGHSQPTFRDGAPPTPLPELMALARQVAGDEGEGRPPAHSEMAQRLLRYLRDSDQFSYSLDTTRVDRTLDPIEDFLFRRRAGHCEYFASALTLMLRSVGIPARLVNGFKGGQLREDGVLVVQRRHAHAWVEAFYDGRWHTLDPTPPAARLASLAQMTGGVNSLQELFQAISQNWSKYVLGMDLATQRRELYEPLRQTLGQIWDSLQGDRETAASLLGSIRDFLSSPRRWFSWQGGLVTFFLLLFISGLVWLGRRVARGVRYLWRRVRSAAGDRGRQVEFYERFRRLCERQGLIRAAGQTQREYAGAVRREFEPLLAGAGLAEFPGRLVEAFYRVRFGDGLLDRELAAEIDQRLTQLEQALGANGASRPGRRAR